jgi:putative membrane protein
MIARFLVMWGANIGAFFVASLLLENVDYSNFGALIVAALVFGLVNMLVRPVVRLFLKTAGAPIVLLTFGLALFFVNVLMLYITSWIVGGFEIGSFGSAVAAAIVIWVVHAIIEAVFGWRKQRSQARS